MITPILWLITMAFVFGLIFGSFLNVCIYRLPQNISILGRSFCPNCKHPIPLYRNIPIVSYLLQFGKSHCCQTRISLQYPTIEVLTGIVSVITILHSDSIIHYFIWFILFMCPLIVISIIDFKLKIIPDVISLPFILVGVGVRFYQEYPDWLEALKISGLGILIGGGVLLLLAEIVSRIKKTEAMGGGDIKLAAMLGAFLGWKALIFVFFTSSVLAIVYAVTRILFDRKNRGETIPFGPFLSVAGMIFWWYGREITDWYFLSHGFSHNPFF